MTISKRNTVAHLVASGGGGIIITELMRYWLQGHEMEGTVIAIGAFFLFVGAYMANSKKSLEAGGFIVDSAVKLGGVFRIGGRRSTDTVVVQQAAPFVGPVSEIEVPPLAKVPAGEKGE